MMTIVLILVSIIAYLISNKLYRNIFNPIFIFVGVNVLSIVLSLLQDFKYSIDTICIIFIITKILKNVKAIYLIVQKST